MKHLFIGGITGGSLVIEVDRSMLQEFSSAHTSHMPVLDFQTLCILSPAAADTVR